MVDPPSDPASPGAEPVRETKFRARMRESRERLEAFDRERRAARAADWGNTEDGSPRPNIRTLAKEVFAEVKRPGRPRVAKHKAATRRRKRRKPVALVNRAVKGQAHLGHGLHAKFLTPEEILRRQLEKVDKRLPFLIRGYVRAQTGDLAQFDIGIAEQLAAKAFLRERLVEEIRNRGVVIEEPVMDAAGNLVGSRVKANPCFEVLKFVDQDLGVTVDQARLSKKSRGQGARDEAITDAVRRDARLRAAGRLALPAMDEDFLREDSIDTEVVASDAEPGTN